MIDLTLSPEAFRHELYASTGLGPSTTLKLAGLVTHRAKVKYPRQRSSGDASRSDKALAALQSSLASHQQEKQARQANITTAVLPAPKSRFAAAKKDRRSLVGSAQPLSPSLGTTPSLGARPNLTPVNDSTVRLQAMRTPLLHLLAVRPASHGDLLFKTHIPKDHLDTILQKIARPEDASWKLTDRAYKDLDVWKFGYKSQDDRQRAIDNAIKAYDRLRIGRDEKIWQLLLRKEERGKGVVLSRLNLGGAQVNRALAPNHVSSPLPQVEGTAESRPASVANTPRLGSSTPRTAGPKGDVMKRLMSKDPKRARAAEEAKEKKRKVKEISRDAAVSDREGAQPAKRQMTEKANPKVMSAEIVASSEDDDSGEEGEIKDEATASPKQLKTAAAKSKPKAPTVSPDSDENSRKSNSLANKPMAKSRDAPSSAKPSGSPAMKTARPATAGKSTPRTATGLSAPNAPTRIQLSPQKPDSKPRVPSPLGAARPRVASDVSDRNAVGVQQRTKQGAGTPRGLGTPNGVRKRQDTVTSTESFFSSASEKSRNDASSARDRKPAPNGTNTPQAPSITSNGNGSTHKSEQGTKRKADNDDSHNTQTTKHRKTTSTSSPSQKHPSSSIATTAAQTSTARTSPDDATTTFDSSASSHSSASATSSSSAAAVLIDGITFLQGVNMAEKFRDQYYPAYATMYDEQAAREARGERVGREERERLWAMHRRLEQIKREIRKAALRGAAEG